METLTEQLHRVIGGEDQDAVAVGEPETLEVEEEALAGEEIPNEDAEEGSVDDGEIRTIAELAEANGWDPEELYALEMGLPNRDPIPLGQLKDEFQRLETERETLRQSMQDQAMQLEQLQQVAQQSQVQDAQATQMVGTLQALDAFLTSDTLAQLKQKDPGAAALKVQEAEQMKARVSGDLQQYQMSMAQQQQMMRQQQLAGGQQYLQEHIPEWRDPQVAKAEKMEVAQAFLQAGYSQQDVAGLSDPRAVMMARELVQLRKQVGAGKTAAKQVRASEKRSLRGGRISKKARTAGLVKRAKETGGQRDVTAAAKALIFGG